MKKIASVFILVFFFLLWTLLSSSKFKDTHEVGKEIANSYIEQALEDENWNWKKPYISEEYPYLSDKDTPSYIEYKISCDTNVDCGWIIVNIDWDDVSIPVAATYWITNYEMLSLKLDKKLEGKDIKIQKTNVRNVYYFWPFEQFIVDENGEVESIGVDQKTDKTLTELNKKIDKMREYKLSEVFKETKKELENRGLTSYEQNSVIGILSWYAAANTPTNQYVSWASTTNCPSRIPCYKQFEFTYTSWACNTGCVPTAIAMIFGYHDRQWTFPNLVTWTAVDHITGSLSSSAITTMINTVRTYVWTTCSWTSPNTVGSTTIWNTSLGIQYAKDKWYLWSTAQVYTSSRNKLLQIIKNEIIAGRPVVAWIQWSTGHAVVAYWYSSDPTSRMIRVNYGWWKDLKLFNISTNPYTAAVDMNIDSINITNNASNTWTLVSVTKFIIAP